MVFILDDRGGEWKENEGVCLRTVIVRNGNEGRPRIPKTVKIKRRKHGEMWVKKTER